ncbi:hypothetical protein GUJ93_ZPchr0004g39781 [Zizania palustris]|uniref:Uncharacterized protein n=1 Tax=Zizania palustris TaxID=103762 RepID=A0A8J5S5T6_ZIZPA|nr:hypothetical protein GUJ93_ZPchr0004g39781 [Zizania palustris]
MPAALFGRATIDVVVPPVFTVVVVSRALWFTKAAGVWEDDDEGATMEHHVHTNHGSVSVVVHGGHDKPVIVTYPNIALNFALM